MDAEIKVTPQEKTIPAQDRLKQEKLFLRQKSYIACFPKDSEAAKAVLEDLARFCRADEPCFHADPRIHALLEGRREVFLRIRDHISLGSQELWDKYERAK